MKERKFVEKCTEKERSMGETGEYDVLKRGRRMLEAYVYFE
jgi:hypothetical protein